MIPLDFTPVSTLMTVSRRLAEYGWLPATSGNLSLKAPDHSVWITRSGSDKQVLAAEDILHMSPAGMILAGHGKPSFETAIHLAIYQVTDATAVFHVHTVANNLIARYADQGTITIGPHEMVKALDHWDETAQLQLPVLPNLADMDQLAQRVVDRLDPKVPGILLENHGIYVFGRSPAITLRYLEAWEFLFRWTLDSRLHDALDRLLLLNNRI
ncbi:MAG: methylthioribulose 1-phosphate dehydratase [Sulfobacillus sp.]|nr:methylthioribulose 1-phosphate dehydratase [Sulfobacillus sp.]